MSQQEVLTLAKEGDAVAIAFLITQALGTKGITVKSARQNNCLHLLLEAEQLPPQDACIRVIVKGLLRLQAASLSTVKIYGRRSSQQLAGWTETVELTQPSISIPLTVGNQGNKKTQVHGNTVTQENQSTREQDQGSKKTEKIFVTSAPQSPITSHQFAGYKSQMTWFLLAFVSVTLLPLLGFVFSSQLQQPQAIKSNNAQNLPLFKPTPSKSAPPKISPTPNVIAATTIPKPSPKPATTTQITSNVKEVSNLSLPSPKEPKNLGENFTIKKEPKNLGENFTIKAVGDIIPGSNYPYNKLPENKNILFQSVKPYLQGADILFGNFESTLTDYPYSSKGSGGGMLFAFRTPPSYVKLLKDAGFHILNVANNHSWDFNEQGFKDTINNIDNAGMQAVGKKGQIVYKTVKGVNVAFIGFSNYGDVHNSLLEIKAGEEIVKEAQKKADVVVISVHAGAEGTGALRVRNENEMFYGENRGNMVLFSQKMIDAGADLILGHGPHVPRALELYKGKLIAYSLGNFMGYRSLSTVGELGQSLILQVEMNPDGDFISGKIIPVQLTGQGIPFIDDNFSSVGLIRSLIKSDFPNTPLKIDDRGQILKK
ncbi:poly-gamma-glutamate biosynthesis protein [Oscillatoriales cyanobacterium USR001]|nr:poly-gamma-glutamate biosynthesis protein [Oscillatoriales cyanobacterium USR001]